MLAMVIMTTMAFADTLVAAAASTKTLAKPTTSIAHPHGAQSTSITLKWNKISGATKYVILYKKSGASKWSSRASFGTSITLKNLSKGSAYYYRVKATAGKVVGDYSTQKSFRTARINFSASDYSTFTRTMEAECGGGDWDDNMAYIKTYCTDVVVNRVVSKKYPDSLTDVLGESGQFWGFYNQKAASDTVIDACYGALYGTATLGVKRNTKLTGFYTTYSTSDDGSIYIENTWGGYCKFLY